MIYVVTEWFDMDAYTFLFDTSKVDASSLWQAAYVKALEIANKSGHPYPVYENKALADDLKDREPYGSDEWERLLAHPPCQVDAAVGIIMSG